MKIIALCGEARHGKNTAADIIHNSLPQSRYVVKEFAFADGVRREARALGWNGLKDEKGRSLLQRIGEERRSTDRQYWIHRLFRDMADFQYKGFQEFLGERALVGVITDCRYINEIERVKKEGGKIWRILRTTPDGKLFDNDLTEEQRGHASECEHKLYAGYDRIILASDLETLESRVREALQNLWWEGWL